MFSTVHTCHGWHIFRGHIRKICTYLPYFQSLAPIMWPEALHIYYISSYWHSSLRYYIANIGHGALFLYGHRDLNLVFICQNTISLTIYCHICVRNQCACHVTAICHICYIFEGNIWNVHIWGHWHETCDQEHCTYFVNCNSDYIALNQYGDHTAH